MFSLYLYLNLMVKKVVITGGAGFIGSNYAHYYVEQHPEDQVIVLDKLTYAGNRENLAALENMEPEGARRRGIPGEKQLVHFRFMQGDIADREFVATLFEHEKPDIVVNFAAETHVDRSIHDPDIFVKTNINGTHTLLEACRTLRNEYHHEVRYHQVSTDEVYGDLGTGSTNFFVETTPLAPNCPYAASKAAADLLVRSYYETYKMPVTISRCSNNYGPYQFPEKLIPYFFYLMTNDKPVPVYGDGLNVRDWLYVLDHCRAIDMIVSRGRMGEVYNIGGHEERTNLDITKTLLKFFGKNDDLIFYVDDRVAHDRRYAMDPSKIENELGWKPSVTFEEGIAKTFTWYEANRVWSEALRTRMMERKHQVFSKEPQKVSR